jgi:alginate O-acetyltransferase complex protein AlgI
MLFTDPLFLFLFLPVFLAGFAALARITGGRFRSPLKLFILLGTLIFYGWRHKPAWWLPFCAAVAFDFLWSRLLVASSSPRTRRLIVAGSVVQNLSLLFIYKYWAWLGGPRLEMPAGISFYLFESMSYVIDVYRGVVVPPRNPLDFFSFIAMFPRMIAGPIVRYSQVVGQMAAWTGPRIRRGLPLFMLGFVYKALWADSFAVFTPYAFAQPSPDLVGSWLGVTCYAFQLYFDFAGYSLMAIGLGHCLGFHFPTNFANPYAAVSIRDFWRRWHVSLSSWLRDYIYIPLGGNQHGEVRRSVNLLVTMGLGGLWHGANLTFLVWGLFHGMLLILERPTEGLRRRWPLAVRRAVTLLFVFVGWTIFRADDMGQALRILSSMSGSRGVLATASPDLLMRHGFAALWLLPAVAYALVFCPRLVVPPEERESWPLPAEVAISVLFVLAVGLTLTTRLVPFLYFQF